MKAVILAGGLGTRISEETNLKPKPMVEIGGRPILWHVMKIYSAQGIHDFVICVGYKGYVIKEYFANYFLHMSDVTFDMRNNSMEVHEKHAEPWRVTIVDTGEDSMTGGRLKRVADFVKDEDFCFTYGDGVADINLAGGLEEHRSAQNEVTLTAVQPPGRYGALELDYRRVRNFREKPEGDGGWINGGFFIVSPSALSRIAGDDASWEGDVLPAIAKDAKLGAFFHRGFWQPMDTLRDKNHLEELWQSGAAPWRIW